MVQYYVEKRGLFGSQITEHQFAGVVISLPVKTRNTAVTSFAILDVVWMKRRIPSPPERLASEDENAFAREEEAREKVAKGDRSYSTPVGNLTGLNATTRSASKRPAPINTGANLHVEKRPTKKTKSQRRRD
ncbi:hypothetical protein F53441_13966 [Fusarium austroafricanum]|uniref:Uncharacterized protein n=1 Tax=Fusarium austroafricanum TaxID=2364996 RepID=A0A8H4JMI1_9HYPO|nr:hypothetical protein F53441_13966 [Fusarium austroafricanum]